ncbi:MAG: DNA polymerase III subunit epsilon [Gammaproteobacteria bacterium]|nr:DNA polymerase III subunit epsilon [Gammaproteobacteria bacterium]
MNGPTSWRIVESTGCRGMRQVFLDTETTGLEISQGHRIIEIGAVEMVNRHKTDHNFHRYINPEREIDEAAIEIHGITNQDLKDGPLFQDLAGELMEFLAGAELVIHNAPFDVGFLNYEFQQAGYGENLIQERCTVVDTLAMARHKYPGQKNSLDALCKRYGVDQSMRTLHGALVDAELLVAVYLQMTGGQTTLLEEPEDLATVAGPAGAVMLERTDYTELTVVRANPEELEAHEKWLELLREQSGRVVWDRTG